MEEWIAEELGLDREGDAKAAEKLDALLESSKNSANLSVLGGLVSGKCAVVFGAGPSLVRDIGKVKKANLHRMDCIFFAADGAAKAVLEEGLKVHVHATDLDGFIDTVYEANRRGAYTVVHAHADNIGKLEEVVPKLKNVVGSCQTEELEHVSDYGGFTDGDRAVYLADYLGAEFIVLAGMDYGTEIGPFSGSAKKDNPEAKIKKLAVGKRLIEELAQESYSAILSLTEGGEKIRGVPNISPEKLKELVTEAIE